MYAPERHQRIVEQARAQGRVDVKDLAELLAVTPETIRRDLTSLERRGLVRRAHGGAIPVERITLHPGVGDRGGINQTDAVNVGQLTSVANGLQSQINNVDRRLRDGVAMSMAAGGVPAVPAGRKFGIFGNVATYDGHGAAGVGVTGVLYDARDYQIQANGSVGMGFATSVVGARGGVSVFW